MSQNNQLLYNMDELQKAKEIFLTDVDEETYQENLAKITDWEKSLIENEEYLSWQEHPVTQKILKKARETYVDAVITLGRDMRNLSQDGIHKLIATQDSCMWVISVSSNDVKTQIEMVKNEINRVLNATN